MIEKIAANQLPFEPGSSPGQPNASGALPDNNVNVSVQVQYASLIERVIQQSQADNKLVQRARELLLSDQLESPENIRKAAENIIKFGI